MSYMIDDDSSASTGAIYDLLYQGDGERLDVYLSREQGYTRNFFHRLLARGDIKVCGKTADSNDPLQREIKKKSYILKDGDRIHIVHPERYMEAHMLAQAPVVPEVEIVYERPDYVVVHKPAGVLTHPNSVRGIEYPSVVGALYHRFKQLPSIGNFIRAGLIHRLDRETDGLLIVVKTERGLKHFQRLFHAKSKAPTLEEKQAVPLHKRYRATSYILPAGDVFLTDIQHMLPYTISLLVEPKIPFYEPKIGITRIHTITKNSPSLDTGDSQVGGPRLKKTRDATLAAAKKRHAVPYTDLAHYPSAIIEMEIFTGRTHQIRYHLSYYGLPIVGDYLYGADDFYQMQLQAYRLHFQDPDGEMIDIQLPPLGS